MHHKSSTAFAAILAAIALCAPAHAQTMYRCGKTYQDRPCDNGQQGKVIGNTEAPRAAAKSVFDASCARRGDDAQKIVWSRDLKAQSGRNRSSQRSGGDVGTMERLNQQRRETDGELKAAGCDDGQRSTQMQ